MSSPETTPPSPENPNVAMADAIKKAIRGVADDSRTPLPIADLIRDAADFTAATSKDPGAEDPDSLGPLGSGIAKKYNTPNLEMYDRFRAVVKIFRAVQELEKE